MSMGIPNYSYPPGAWATYNALGMPDVYIQILNPNSGPGTTPDPGYVSAYAAALAKGTLILGYVPTTYGARPIADVKADIDKYYTFYPQLSGIFFDEMQTRTAPRQPIPFSSITRRSGTTSSPSRTRSNSWPSTQAPRSLNAS